MNREVRIVKHRSRNWEKRIKKWEWRNTDQDLRKKNQEMRIEKQETRNGNLRSVKQEMRNEKQETQTGREKRKASMSRDLLVWGKMGYHCNFSFLNLGAGLQVNTAWAIVTVVAS